MKTNDNGLDREMTEAELAAFNILQKELEVKQAARQAALDSKKTALASARAKLAALGLSEAEVAAIIGG